MADAAAASAMVQDLNRLKEELPEEKKNGNIGKMISHIINLAQNGWSFYQVQTKLQKTIDEVEAVGQLRDKVERMFDEVWAELKNCEQAADPQGNGSILNRAKQGIISVLNYVAKNGPETMKKHLYDHFDSSPEEFYQHVEQTSTINEHEETTKLILDGMRSYHQTESDKMIINMTKESVTTAVSQFLKLYITWKEISSASNVIADSCELTMINKNLEEMKTSVTELLDHCKSNPNDSSLSLRVSMINTLFTSTLIMISNLRVTIDGHIQRLDLLADTSVVDGVANVANAAAQGYHLWNAWSNLSTFAKALGVGFVALFTGLAFGNFATSYHLSRSTLKDLRVKFKEAAHLQIQLQDLFRKATLAVKEVQCQCIKTRETGNARVDGIENLPKIN